MLCPEAQPLTLLCSILTEKVPLLGRASPNRALRGVQYPLTRQALQSFAYAGAKKKQTKFNGGVCLRRQLTFGDVTNCSPAK